jgi:hypothetical protein
MKPEEALLEMKVMLQARKEADGFSSNSGPHSKNSTVISKLPAIKK